ncbi:MAG: ATP-binding protein [Oligoflexia bacterium]|nr:ATP-binding protein [Oligoflexia bacterium]
MEFHLAQGAPLEAVVRIQAGRLICDDAALALSGYGRGGFPGPEAWLERLFGEERATGLRAFHRERHARGLPAKSVATLHRGNGESRLVELMSTSSTEGETWLLLDVTERLQAEERFRVIFENSRDAYLVFDGDEILDCNPAAIALMGCADRNEALHFDFDAFSPPFQPDGRNSLEKAEAMNREAHLHGFKRFEWQHQRRDGTPLFVEVTLIPVRISLKPALVAIWRDLSEQKLAEARLVQSSKMAELGRMSGALAHEINNPLTVIRCRAERLEMELDGPSGPSPEEIRDAIQAITSTVDRIALIVRGLRNFGRDSVQEPPAPTELRHLLNETLAFCEARLRRGGVTLEVSVDEPTLSVECRPVQLSQVLLNLLNNAFDAIEPLPSRWIRVEARRGDQLVEISVTDSGKGIPPELREKIMQPFFSTKGIGKGTGLGLSISHDIIEAHCGSLELDPASRHTRFVIRLPMTFSRGAAAAPPARAT